jgi:hypothetical protein
VCYVAVQTSSLIPAILFHASYNSIMLGIGLAPQYIDRVAARWPRLAEVAIDQHDGGFMYRLPVVIMSGLLSVGILAWFHRLPYRATKEEKLSDARALQSQQLLGAPSSE